MDDGKPNDGKPLAATPSASSSIVIPLGGETIYLEDE
jgi:hypothetical protein